VEIAQYARVLLDDLFAFHRTARERIRLELTAADMAVEARPDPSFDPSLTSLPLDTLPGLEMFRAPQCFVARLVDPSASTQLF